MSHSTYIYASKLLACVIVHRKNLAQCMSILLENEHVKNY